jgi:polar amino acid transport system substrate-binding protein
MPEDKPYNERQAVSSIRGGLQVVEVGLQAGAPARVIRIRAANAELRRRWRVALVLAVMAIGAVSVSGTAQTKELHLASTPWSPFTNAPGQARFAIDLVHAALERIGITADTTIVAEGTLTPALLEGRFDGSAALWRDDERERRLVYSQPYLQNRLVLVGRRASDVSATTLAGLVGKRIALVGGFSYGEVSTNSKGTAYVRSRNEEESLQKVLAGDADYALMDELVVQYLIRNYPEEVRTRLALGSVPLLVRSLHFAVRRDLPDAQAIVDRFNAELRRMIADRSYHRLLQLEWIAADVDGDGRTESVPASDQVGQKPPDRRYELLTPTAAEPERQSASNQRFYFGGQVYDSWSNVPDHYKVGSPGRTPWGSTVAPVFTFRW